MRSLRHDVVGTRHAMWTTRDMHPKPMAVCVVPTLLTNIIPLPHTCSPISPCIMHVQAGTGYFYITSKNPRNVPHKLTRVKFDPRVNAHVLFVEGKMK